MDFEFEIIKWFQNISNGFLDILAELITMLGEQYLFMAVIAFIYFVYNKKLGETLAYSVFVSAAINNVIKGVVKAQRPFELDSEIISKREHTATGYSFPSGHAQNSSTFYTSIGLMIKKKKIYIIIGVVIGLIAVSRVYLGVHFPHDVIAGVLFGISAAILGDYLYNKYGMETKSRLILLSITSLIFLPFLFIYYKSDLNAMIKYRDFYNTYAMFIGFSLAITIENKYVGFTCDTPLKRRIYRFVIALVLLIGIQFGFKVLLPEENIFIDMLRYFLTIFIPLGLFPLTFKKLNLL